MMTREEADRQEIFGYINNELTRLDRTKTKISEWTELNDFTARRIELKKEGEDILTAISDLIMVTVWRDGEDKHY